MKRGATVTAMTVAHCAPVRSVPVRSRMTVFN
jgi:hypothetical protein